MRRAARAIVVHDNKLLVIHRNKFGQEYYVLPGGAVEIGEPIPDAAVREVAEEASIQVSNPRLVFIDHAGDMYGDQYVFLCDYVSGEPLTREDTHEFAINKMGKNLYKPQWMPIEGLKSSAFVSEELKQALVAALANGWPKEPVAFQSNQ